MSAPLYSKDILRLATSIPHQSRLAAPMVTVEMRSKPCGSRVSVDVELDTDGRVRALGLAVSACVFGPASTALFGAHAIGCRTSDLARARDELTDWLAGVGPTPDWPGITILAPVLRYSTRHAAARLVFEAAADAAAEAFLKLPA